MDMLDHFRLMARYNAWMNDKVYAAAGKLSAADLAAPRGAFFGSVLGTLNHLMVADLIWLRRCASLEDRSACLAPALALSEPTRLDQTLFPDFADLAAARAIVDPVFVDFTGGLQPADLDRTLVYRRFNGEPQRKLLGHVLSHVFNHQTHHRGQVTTLFTQGGLDVGATDLILLFPDVEE